MWNLWNLSNYVEFVELSRIMTNYAKLVELVKLHQTFWNFVELCGIPVVKRCELPVTSYSKLFCRYTKPFSSTPRLSLYFLSHLI